ncbi:hypothetical protein D0T87_22365 [Bacteroides sp. 51]|nr:hypothetical protein [Bacteroides sp. 51]
MSTKRLGCDTPPQVKRVINQAPASCRSATKQTNDMSKQKTWDVILKVIIAAISALAGALGASAMTL